MTHTVIVTPLAPGVFNISWAQLTYKSVDSEDVQVGKEEVGAMWWWGGGGGFSPGMHLDVSVALLCTEYFKLHL